MRSLALLLSMAAAVGLLGCGNGSVTDPAPPSVVRLRSGVEPDRLLRAADGSLWVTESARAQLVRVLPDGRTRYYRLPSAEAGIDDIAEGPDQMIWLSGGGKLFRVEPENGSVAVVKGYGGAGNPEVGFTGPLTAGPKGALWYSSQGTPDRIVRITPGGNATGFAIGGPAMEEMSGIAYGADGALWFTQASSSFQGEHPDAIGRLDVDGHYTRWQLPEKEGRPTRIVAGPGGDLWFNEEASDRIGRISPTGQIKEFTLPPGVSPTGLTVSGGQVWFSSAHKVGRVSRDGEISEWRIDGAGEIADIAPDPPRGVWLADADAGVLRRFTPGGS